MVGKIETQQVTRDILSKIVAEYAPQKVILFGSYAYGEPDEDSDIDLLIIKDTDKRPIERWIEVKRLLRDRNRTLSAAPGPHHSRRVRGQERRRTGSVVERTADWPHHGPGPSGTAGQGHASHPRGPLQRR